MKPKKIILFPLSGKSRTITTTIENEFSWADGDKSSMHMQAAILFADGWDAVRVQETKTGCIICPVA